MIFDDRKCAPHFIRKRGAEPRMEPGARLRAMKEGREARKEGRPRKSPYEGIELLSRFHGSWLSGWDDMDHMMARGAVR